MKSLTETLHNFLINNRVKIAKIESVTDPDKIKPGCYIKTSNSSTECNLLKVKECPIYGKFIMEYGINLYDDYDNYYDVNTNDYWEDNPFIGRDPLPLYELNDEDIELIKFVENAIYKGEIKMDASGKILSYIVSPDGKIDKKVNY